MVRNTGLPALPPVAMTMPLRARMFMVRVFGRVPLVDLDHGDAGYPARQLALAVDLGHLLLEQDFDHPFSAPSSPAGARSRSRGPAWSGSLGQRTTFNRVRLQSSRSGAPR